MDKILLPLPLREGINVYATDGAYDHNGNTEPHGVQFSPDIDTPSDDFYQVHQTKHGKQPPTPLSGLQKDHHRKSTPSGPENLQSVMVLFMSLLKCINSSVLRLLLPSRNTILWPSTSFAKKRGIHVTDIADHESSPSDDITHEDQPDPQQFEDAPENEIDPILDYINSQHHQEEDMNNAPHDICQGHSDTIPTRNG